MSKKKCKGFTLIELSIVIIIIGLIIGAIVVGQEVVRNSTLRAQISQIEQYKTAVASFETKYNCLPGDCVNAVTFGLGTSTSNHNGNGNGIIGGSNGGIHRCQYSDTWKEGANFFRHLSQAQLIDGTYEGFQGEAWNSCFSDTQMKNRFPAGKIDGKHHVLVGAFPNPYTNDMRVGGQGFLLQSTVNSIGGYGWMWGGLAIAQIRDAQSIDVKIDDGSPLLGNVALTPHSGNWEAASALRAPTGHSCIQTTYSSTLSSCRTNYGNQRAAIIFPNAF